MENRDLIEKLSAEKALTKPQWMQLISSYTDADRELARAIAQDLALRHFGRNVFFRGIVEFTNYCKNDCLYCGIRRDDLDVQRYRLSAEDILECCREGYGAGFRTFVLQGGEDPYYTDDIMTDIVSAIRAEFPDCAITLSIGEKSRESYQRYYDAGANRYLLRHETANPEHYAKMHPAAQTFENRMRCLRDLKDIGYQTGAGMMVGAPYQTAATLADDMMFLGAFRPQMIGMGPFIPHHGTPFRNFPRRRQGGHAVSLVPVPHHAAVRAAAGHHGPGHRLRRRQKAGGAGGSQRHHAQSLPDFPAQKIHALR